MVMTGRRSYEKMAQAGCQLMNDCVSMAWSLLMKRFLTPMLAAEAPRQLLKYLYSHTRQYLWAQSVSVSEGEQKVSAVSITLS